MNDANAKERAKRAWGSVPTGATVAEGAKPGTKQFFDRGMAFRSEIEQPWLSDVVPFNSMRGKRVLEIGFGPGFDAFTLIKNGADYSGVDITPENVLRTRKHLAFYDLSPNVREGDAEALPFSDNSFDMVYSNGVLHHTPNMQRAFSEAARVLNRGGEFYVILYHKNSLFGRVSSVVNALARGIPVRDRFRYLEYNEAGESPLVNTYSRTELKSILQTAGFKIEATAVRKLLPEDMPLYSAPLSTIYRAIPQRLYDIVGKFVGWYIIAHARKI